MAQRGVPLAVVHQVGELQGHLLLVVIGLLIQAQLLQLVVGVVEDGAAGSLVDAPGLHAHQAVLDDIRQADAVFAAQLVELGHHLHAGECLPVQLGGHALLKVQGDVGGLVGGLLGGDAQFQEARLVVLGLVGGVLQIQALVGEVPQVLVLGVVGLPVDFQGDIVGLGVLNFLLAGLDIPDTPGGDDLHIRSKGLDGQLEADLVVALAGAAVADGVGALFFGDVHNALGDDGTGKGGAQQVLVLIHSPGLHRGVDVVLDELLFQIQHVQFGGAGLLGLFLQAVQLGALAHVAGNGDDLAVVVVFLQPGDDDRGV